MSEEIKELIKAVKQSSNPVQEVIDNFFKDVTWSPLLDEIRRMSAAEKRLLIAKLTTERK
jgi:hypothetical protein